MKKPQTRYKRPEAGQIDEVFKRDNSKLVMKIKVNSHLTHYNKHTK